MKKLLAAMAILICGAVLAANVPLRNRFEGPIQSDIGIMCSNVASGGTAWTMEPCGSGTDAANPFTSGNLFKINGDPDGDGTFEDVCYETWNGKFVLDWDDNDSDSVIDDGERGSTLRVYGMSTAITEDPTAANGSSRMTAQVLQQYYDNETSSSYSNIAIQGWINVPASGVVRGLANNLYGVNGAAYFSGTGLTSTDTDLFGVQGVGQIYGGALQAASQMTVSGVNGSCGLDSGTHTGMNYRCIQADYPTGYGTGSGTPTQLISLWAGGIPADDIKDVRAYSPYAILANGQVVIDNPVINAGDDESCEDGPELWLENNGWGADNVCQTGAPVGHRIGLQAPQAITYTGLGGTIVHTKYQFPNTVTSTSEEYILRIAPEASTGISTTKEFVLDSSDPDTVKVKLEWASPATIVSSGGAPTGSGTQYTLPIWATTTTLGDSRVSQVSGQDRIVFDPNADGVSGYSFQPYITDSGTDGTLDTYATCPDNYCLKNITASVAGIGSVTGMTCRPCGGTTGAACFPAVQADGGLSAPSSALCVRDTSGTGDYAAEFTDGGLSAGYSDLDSDGTLESGEFAPLTFYTFELDGTTQEPEYSARAQFTAGNLTTGKGAFLLLDANLDASGNYISNAGRVDPSTDGTNDLGADNANWGTLYVRSISPDDSNLTIVTDGAMTPNITRLTIEAGAEIDQILVSNTEFLGTTDGAYLGYPGYEWGNAYLGAVYGSLFSGSYLELDDDGDGTLGRIRQDDTANRPWWDKDSDGTQDSGDEFLDEPIGSGTANTLAMFDADGTGLVDSWGSQGMVDGYGDSTAESPAVIISASLSPYDDGGNYLGFPKLRWWEVNTYSVRIGTDAQDPGYLSIDTTGDGTEAWIAEDSGRAFGDTDRDGTKDAGEEYLDIGAATPVYYDPTGLTVATGTLDSGTYSSLGDVDGTLVSVSEVTGVPGFNVEVAFSGITGDLTYFYIYGYYDGNPAHTVNIQAYDYDGSAWETYDTLPDAAALDWHVLTLDDPDAYVDGSGNAKIRFYHATTGTGTHDLYLDYVSAIYSGGAAIPYEHGALVGLSDNDHPQYMLAATYDSGGDGTVDSAPLPSGTANTVAQFDADGTGLANSDLVYDGTTNVLSDTLRIEDTAPIKIGSGAFTGTGVGETITMSDDTDFVVTTTDGYYGGRGTLKLTSSNDCGSGDPNCKEVHTPYHVVWNNTNGKKVTVSALAATADRALAFPDDSGTILTSGTTTTYTGTLYFSSGIGRTKFIDLDYDGDSTVHRLSQIDGAYAYIDSDADATRDAAEPYITAYPMSGSTYDSGADGTVDSAAAATSATKIDSDLDGTSNVSVSSPAVKLDGDDDGATDVEIEADSYDWDWDGTEDESAALDFGTTYPQNMGNPFSSRITIFDEFVGGTPTIIYCSNCGNSGLVDADPTTASTAQMATAATTGATANSDVYMGYMSSTTSNQLLIPDKADHFAVRARANVAGQSGARMLIGGLRLGTAANLQTKTDGIFFWCDPASDLDGDGTVGDADTDGTGTAAPDGDCADANEDADDCYWRIAAYNNATDQTAIDTLTTNAYVIKTTIPCMGGTSNFDIFEILRSGSDYDMRINGVSVGTLNSDIPADSRRLAGWTVFVETGMAATKTISIDWFYYNGRR